MSIPAFKRFQAPSRELMLLQDNTGLVLDAVRNGIPSKQAQYDGLGRPQGYSQGPARSMLNGVLFQGVRFNAQQDVVLPHGLNVPPPGAEFFVVRQSLISLAICASVNDQDPKRNPDPRNNLILTSNLPAVADIWCF